MGSHLSYRLLQIPIANVLARTFILVLGRVHRDASNQRARL